MATWNKEYYGSLVDKFTGIIRGLDDRLEAVIDGRVTPAVDDILIGSARKMRAAALFFDIRGFTSRTESTDLHVLKKTLLMLDCIIPMVMQIVYDVGGYIEKNTGDGLMAIIGVESDDHKAANDAMDAATTIFYVIKNLINPYLTANGIQEVNARIGIDLGPLLIARIGLPSGTAKHPRSFLTAVGPAANLACKIQQMAGTNEIWAGDLIRANAETYRQVHFQDKTPTPWVWRYDHSPELIYRIWKYGAVKTVPA